MTNLTFPGVALSSIGAINIGGPWRFASIGDSISADGIGLTSTYFSNWGYLAWFRRFMGRRIDFPNTRGYAVAGSKISDAVATQLPQALADNSDAVIVHTGTNSIGVETDAALISGLQTIYDSLRATGKVVIAIPVRAHKTPSSFSTQQRKQVGKLNRWIYQYCRANSGMLFFSFDPYLIDWSTGDTQASYFRDGIHDNLLSAKMLGKALADWLSPLFPLQDGGFTGIGDIYDATYNPTGNLYANGLLAGTAGALSNGATGTAPDSWRIRRGLNSGTTTLAGSSVPDSTYGTMKRAVMTIGGTGDSNNCVLDSNNTTAAALGVSVGDLLELEAEIAWNFTTGAFPSLWLQLFVQDAGFATLIDSSDGTSSSNGPFPAGDAGSGFYRTAQITVPTNVNYINAVVTVQPPAAGSVAGTVTVGRVALRKVM